MNWDGTWVWAGVTVITLMTVVLIRGCGPSLGSGDPIALGGWKSRWFLTWSPLPRLVPHPSRFPLHSQVALPLPFAVRSSTSLGRTIKESGRAMAARIRRFSFATSVSVT